MLKEIALALTTFIVLGCSTAQNDAEHSETGVATPIANETGEAQEELRSSKVAANERGVINVAVENWNQPAYPDEAREKKVAGVVLVRVNIERDGRVSDAKAESGHPLLIKAAEEWARGRRIIPHRVEGKTVTSSGILVVKFGR